MDQFSELVLQFLTQFAGGPGPAENNLVRFAIPAAMWAILLYVAWSRQKHGDYPREKLLVWGFALGLLRELVMLARLSVKIINESGHDALCAVVEPFEHALALASIVVIAASFLRYILADRSVSNRYLRIGLGATAITCLITIIWWPMQLNANPQIRFHDAGAALLLHSVSLVLMGAAIVILIKKRGWLRNVVILAFSFLFMAEFLILLNYFTNRAYVTVLCPIGNTFHILAVFLFGFVYFREMSLEKNKAQRELNAYHDQLEELVSVRTAELTEANKKLEKAAVLEERQRIAAEMHDGLAQTLSYLGMKTHRAGELLLDGQVDQVMGEFDYMHKAIGQATFDVRRSIATLQKDPLPRQTLQELLAQLTSDQVKDSQQAIELVNRLSRPLYLDPENVDQVIKIVQEALLNAKHHSFAQRIIVRLSAKNDTIEIAVSDDGQGFDFDEQAMAVGDHFGLSIMQARAARIGGDLHIYPRLGHGTKIVLTWRPDSWQNLDDSKNGEQTTDYEAVAI